MSHLLNSASLFEDFLAFILTLSSHILYNALTNIAEVFNNVNLICDLNNGYIAPKQIDMAWYYCR